MIFVRLGGHEQVIRTLQTGPQDLQRITIARLSQSTYDDAQVGAGRHRKTGASLQSLYNRSVPKGRAVGHDLDRAPQVEFVLFGSRPHDIRPKNKKTLRFAIGGRFVFAKVVHHPGYRGDGYLFTAADRAIAKFAVIVDAAMKDAF